MSAAESVPPTRGARHAARRSVRRRAACALGVVLASACEHPIAVVTPHAEVADVVLADARGTTLARTRDNRRWEGGPLVLCDGRALDLRPVLLDFQAAAVNLAGRRDVTLRAEPDGAPLVVWEPLGTAAGAGATSVSGRLIGAAPGSTRLRFLVWHVTHADLVTPWLDVVVRPATAPDCAR